MPRAKRTYLKEKSIPNWLPQNNLLGNQLQPIDPEKSLFIISAPLPNDRTYPILSNNCIPHGHFPIQITNSPLPHRINRKFSFLEYFKQELKAVPTLLIVEENINIDVFQHDLSNELAYLGFTIFDKEGKPITPVSNTTLEIIPIKYPYLQSIPLPPRELISKAADAANIKVFKAKQNSEAVANYRERNPTEPKGRPEKRGPYKPRKSSSVKSLEEKPYNPSIFSSIPEMPEIESDEDSK